jgi:hypothetical protein
VLWPLLRERGSEEAATIVPAMEKQHHAIEQAHATVIALLPRWRAMATGGEELATALEQLLTVLLEHMALEEKEVLPLAAKYVTAAEWDQMGQHGMAKSPRKTLPLIFGMVMYEGDPEVVKAVLSHAPLPARLLMPRIAPRLYASCAKRVHGTATPPRIGV